MLLANQHQEEWVIIEEEEKSKSEH